MESLSHGKPRHQIVGEQPTMGFPSGNGHPRPWIDERNIGVAELHTRVKDAVGEVRAVAPGVRGARAHHNQGRNNILNILEHANSMECFVRELSNNPIVAPKAASSGGELSRRGPTDKVAARPNNLEVQ